MSDIIETSRGIPVTSIRDLDSDAHWFRDLLSSHGVVPAENSAYARSLKAVEDMARVYRNEVPLVPDALFPLMLREALGTDYVIKAINRALPVIEPTFAGKWGTFAGTDICLTRDAPRSLERDTAWELLVAALCAQYMSDVTLAVNPDVRCQFKGTPWGIECKILYSRDEDHQIDRIVKGAKQLETSDARLGVVAINATNLINHDLFFGPMPDHPDHFFSFREPRMAIGLLTDELNRMVSRINLRKLLQRLTQDKDGELRVKTRAVLFFAQTAASVGGVMMLLSVVIWYRFRRLIASEEEFLYFFNNSANTALTHRI